MSSTSTPKRSPKLPLAYRIFFLYIEPLSTLIGAYYAYITPHTYLYLTHAASTPPLPSSNADPNPATSHPATWSSSTSPSGTIPTSTLTVLAQLANEYILFALNEALVLRATNDLRVWRMLLVCLLVADLGHLLAMKGTVDGEDWGGVYGRFWEWNAMGWGCVGFVYLGALMRVSFLLGVGFGKE